MTARSRPHVAIARDPQGRRSDAPLELGDTVAGTFDHYFTWDEIEAELADGGFTVVETSSAPYPHLVCRAM